jgi:tetratricopeptide (TPR) repeat protein
MSLDEIPLDGKTGFVNATRMRECGNLEDAEELYRQCLVSRPEWPPALLGLGLCARRRRDDDAAGMWIEAAVRHDPDYRDARHELATLLRERGAFAEAQKHYEVALRLCPNWPPALVGMGLCARSQGDFKSALVWLSHAIEADPGYRDGQYEYATLLREHGQHTAAEEHYLTILDWAPALLGLALCRLAQRDLVAGRRLMLRSLELDPSYFDARIELGTFLLQQGEAANAEEHFRGASALRPTAIAAWRGLARCALRKNRPETAQKLLSDALHLAPNHVDLAIELAACEHRLGSTDSALALLRPLATQTSTTAGRAWAALGDHALRAGHLRSAEVCLRSALSAPPPEIDVPALLAHTLAKLGRRREALSLLAKGQGTPAEKCFEIRLLQQVGHSRAALRLARSVANLAKENVQLWHEWFELERFGGNESELANCLAVSPARNATERAYLAHALGQIHEQNWDLPAALNSYEEALAHDDQLAWIHESIARVAMLELDLTRAECHLAHAAGLIDMERGRKRGKPEVASTHLGRILLTYLEGSDLVADLVRLRSSAARIRIGGLREYALERRRSLPTAIAVLVELRRARRLKSVGNNGSHKIKIPARILQYWDSSDPPEDISHLMASWRDLNPEYECIRHDEESARDYLLSNFGQSVMAAFDRAPQHAMKSDLFRLAWLYREGGVYVDADDACLVPLAEFLPRHVGFVSYQEEYGTLGNNFLAVSSHHPIISLALSWAIEALQQDTLGLVWLATGPGLITRAFTRHVAHYPIASSSGLAGAAILTRAELRRFVMMHCDVSYKNTVRHWAKTVTDKT